MRVPRWAPLEHINNDSVLLDFFDQRLVRSVDRPNGDSYVGLAPLDMLVAQTYENDSLWWPLARLLKHLPGLVDFIYACPPQLPPCLLQTLHKHLPACRLHHYTFFLRCLNGNLTNPDPHELALVTSPCLYSIHVRYGDTKGQGSNGRPSYQRGVINNMIEGLAPNLKEVHLFRETRERKQITARPRLPPKAWRRATVEAVTFTSSRALLHELEIQGNMNGFALRSSELHLGRSLIDDWKTRVDFSALRVLKLRHPVALGPNLRKILLSSSFNTTSSRYRPKDAANFSPSQILLLAHHCPGIENLRLQVRRSRGDSDEVAAYKALGRFPRLRHVTLTLDASPPRWLRVEGAPPSENPTANTYTNVEDHYDEYDAELLLDGPWPFRRGHVRDVFVNSAVDETLARDIFDVIASTRMTGHPSQRSLFDTMIIRVVGGTDFCGGMMTGPPGRDLRPYITNLARDWFLERGVRDDAPDLVHVVELGRTKREESDSEERGHVFRNETLLRRDNGYLEIFRRLWPAARSVPAQGSSDWRDDWKSWPLHRASPVTVDLPRRSRRLQGLGVRADDTADM